MADLLLADLLRAPAVIEVPDWAVISSIIASALVVVNFLIQGFALGVIPENRRPSTGMAWLLAIVLVPVLGLALFLLFGSPRVGRTRHLKQTEINELIAARVAGLERPKTTAPSAYLQTVVDLNQRLGALPLSSGNRVHLIEDYRGSIQAMAHEVRRAESFVHVEFYITAWDEVTDPLFQAMTEAVERGVDVRLLFDHLGSRGIPGYQEMLKRLATTGIQWYPMLPIEPLKGRFRRPDLRNHRKLLVVDGKVGFTGSLNLTEPGYNKPKNHKVGREWVELMLRIEGPAVASLDAIFATDWDAETDEQLHVEAREATGSAAADALEFPEVPEVAVQVVPSGPGFESENNLRMFTSLLYAATERISITSPYFVPDESLLYAVTTAAQRGIAVELFVSEQADQFMVGHAQASYYAALLRAGVRIYLYPAPWVLHSKHFSIDDDVAVVGSSNMDMRSFALNYELSALLIGREMVEKLRVVEDHYRSLSRELTPDEWQGRPFRLRYVDNVMRLTSALQ